MICYAPRLPLLDTGAHQTTEYGTPWVQQVIQRAAAEAGHLQWVFAQDIALGVMEYLREKFQGRSITLADLGHKIARTIEAVGFPDIAARVEISPPPLDISLADLARESDPAMELVFFHLLAERVRAAAENGATTLRLHGLQPCLDLLGNRVGRDEVLDFATHHAVSGGVTVVVQ